MLGGLLADFLPSREVVRLVDIGRLLTAVGACGATRAGCGRSGRLCGHRVGPPSPGILAPAASFVSLHWARASLGVTISLCLAGALVNFLDIAPWYVAPPRPPAPWPGRWPQSLSELGGTRPGRSLTCGFPPAGRGAWPEEHLLALGRVGVAGLLFYLIFGRVEVQDWAREETLARL